MEASKCFQSLGTDSPLSEILKEKEWSYMMTRSSRLTQIECTTRTVLGQNSFVYQTAKLWNMAPNELKTAECKNKAKNLIKLFAKKLPI